MALVSNSIWGKRTKHKKKTRQGMGRGTKWGTKPQGKAGKKQLKRYKKKITSRTVEMIKKGAILEVKKFIKLKVAKNKSANKAIGVTEIKEYIDKKIQINEVIEKISIKTRHQEDI